MNQNKKLALNSAIQIISKFVIIAIGFVSIKILTTSLGVDQFGAYITVTTYLIMASILADLGLNVILTTEISKVSHEEAQKSVSNIFTLRLVIAIIIIGLLASSSVWLFPQYSTQVKLLVGLGSIGTIGFSLSQVLIGIFQKNLRTDKIAIGDLLVRLTLVLGVIGLAVFDRVSLEWVMVFYCLSGIIQASYTFWEANKYYSIGLAFDWGYWSTVVKKSLPFFVIVAFNLIYYRIDTIMLSILKSPQDVGLYGAAYKILEILITFPGMFMGLMLPIYAKYWHANRDKYQEVFQQSFVILSHLSLPITVAGILLSDKILLLIAGPEYLPATQALQWLFVGIGMIFLGNLLGHGLISADLQHRSMYISILGAAFNVILNIFLIPRYSYTGAAIATAITESMVCILYLITFAKFGKVIPRLSTGHILNILATIGMAIVLLITDDWNIFLQSITAAMTFVIISILPGLQYIRKQYFINIQE